MAWIKAMNAVRAAFVVGALFSVAVPSFGQEAGGAVVGSDTGVGAQQLQDMDMGITALQAQIATLTARLETLEKEKEGPLTVKGPFIVTDAQGTQVFRVDPSAGGGEMTVIGGKSRVLISADDAATVFVTDYTNTSTLTTESGAHINIKSGNKQFFAGPTNGSMMSFVREGQTTITLLARSGSPIVDVDSGAKSVSIGAKGAAFGVAVLNGDEPRAALGDPGDGMASLRIYQKGSVALQAGLHKNGQPGFSVWDGDNPLVRIEKAETGGAGGQVKVFDSGQQVVTLGTVDNNIGLQVKKDSDTIFAGKSAEGPEFSLQQGADKIFNVNSVNGATRLMLAKDQATNWMLSAADSLQLEGKKDGKTITFGIGSALKGLLLQSGEKTETFIGQLQDGTNGMAIYGKGDTALLSAAVIDGTPGFRVRSDGGKDVAAITAKDRKEGEIKLFDGSGETAKIGGIGGSGTLVLSQGGKPTLTLGPTETKATAALRTYNGDKMVLAAGTAPGGNGAVIAFDGAGTAAAGLEGDPASGGAVYALSKGQVVASVNSNDRPGEGLVIVRSNAGASIAWLGNSAGKGGEVVAANPSGGAVFAGRYLAGQDGPGNVCIGTNKGTKCLGVGLTGMEGFH